MKHTYKGTSLVLSIDSQEQATLRELQAEDPDTFGNDQQMIEFMEPLVCNSELDWADSSETGDLTDAPMLAIRNEEGVIIERWAWMSYQVKALLSELLENGEAKLVSE